MRWKGQHRREMEVANSWVLVTMAPNLNQVLVYQKKHQEAVVTFLVRPTERWSHRVLVEVALFSYVQRPYKYPGKAVSVMFSWHGYPPTSLPLWTHLLQGRVSSHLRCFRLQFTQADATCALVLRVARGDICGLPERGGGGGAEYCGYVVLGPGPYIGCGSQGMLSGNGMIDCSDGLLKRVGSPYLVRVDSTRGETFTVEVIAGPCVASGGGESSRFLRRPAL